MAQHIHSRLMALSPLDGRYEHHVSELHELMSEYALNRARVRVEIEWFISLANNQDITEVSSLKPDELHFLHQIIHKFSVGDAENIKSIEKVINHDVKAVEYWLKKQLKDHPTLRNYCEFIHFACTSEDINNLSYAQMINDARAVLVKKIHGLNHQLCDLSEKYSYRVMLARTHGQPASPTTFGKEIAIFVHRINTVLFDIEKTPMVAKMNGAVGNYHAHTAAYPEIDWIAHNQTFVESLGFSYTLYSTQVETQDNIAKIFSSFAQLNTILIDLCRDFWGYISIGYLRQQPNPHEVGSSTMPHKVNPIDFENAESNLGFANNLFRYFSRKLPVSRWQRDLTDSTLKRNIGLSFGHSLLAYTMLIQGLNKVAVDDQKMDKDLDDNWEIVAEAIQSVMRRHGIINAYERVKSFSRGKKITSEKVKEFIESLELPEIEKEKLKKITPYTYIGYAPEIARRAVSDYRDIE